MTSDPTPSSLALDHHRLAGRRDDTVHSHRGEVVLMPKRVARLVRRYPITTILLVLTVIVAVGSWRVEHLYNCANDYAERNSYVNQKVSVAESHVAELELQVEQADNDVSEALGDISQGHGGPADFDEIGVAANRRDQLGDRLTSARLHLATVKENNPTPEPTGTFC